MEEKNISNQNQSEENGINNSKIQEAHKTNNPFVQQEKWDGEKQKDNKYKIFLFSTIGILVFISLLLGFFKLVSYYRSSSFAHERVLVEFEGAPLADSAMTEEYKVVLRNDNRATLNDVNVELNYSNNFQINGEQSPGLEIINPTRSKIQIGSMKGGERKEISFRGVFYAPKESTVFLRGKMSYRPNNSSSVYETDSQLGVNIASSPIILEVDAPLDVSSGDSFDYVLRYRNEGTAAVEDILIKADYPTGYTYASSVPEPSKDNNVWYIGRVDSGSSGEIRVNGSLSEGTSSGRIIEVKAGKNSLEGNFVAYSQTEKRTALVKSPIEIVQTVSGPQNNVIYPGESIDYTIKYKNIGEELLRDVIITAQLEGEVLDFANISVTGGAFDGSSNSVIWKASGVPALASISPKEEGEVSFSVPVVSKLSVEEESDKNFQILSSVKVDSSDIRTPSGEIKSIVTPAASIKVGTTLFLETQGYFRDWDEEGIGSMPMKVGKETEYTIYWYVRNLNNDIENATVTAYLPTGVSWKGHFNPEDANIRYNGRTNQVTWEVGYIPAGTGIINSPKEVSFKVSVIPQVNQIGEPLELIGESTMTAEDVFTNVEIQTKTKSKNTELTEDPSLARSDYIVYE